MARTDRRDARVWVFSSFFALPGLAAAGFGIHGIAMGHVSRSWPTAQGEIESSTITESRKDHTSSDEAKVVYVFKVTAESGAESGRVSAAAGDAYTADRIAYGRWSSDRNEAERTVSSYPPHKQVMVHYDPTDPRRSVLETGAGAGCWSVALLGIVFAGIPVAGLLAFRRCQNAAK